MIKVTIEEYVPMYNLIRIDTDEKSFSIYFSDDVNPLFEMKAWLEAIVTGVQKTSFVFNGEANPIVFEFENIGNTEGILKIVELENKNSVLIEVDCSIYHVIRTFYKALIDYWEDFRFIDMIEHSIQLGTMITKQLRIKRKTLLEKLVDMEKEDVIKCAESAITSYYLPTSEFERSKFKALRKFESNENFDKLKKEERYILIH